MKPGNRIASNRIDFEALQTMNPDIIGWIGIPDTNINYPILQASDNTYYLQHGYDRQPHPYGAVFMDANDDKDFQQVHTFLYAHNVPSGEMFHDVEFFKDEEFYNSHPVFHIWTPNHTYALKIFSFYQTRADSETYQNGYIKNKTTYMQMIIDSSWYPLQDKEILSNEDNIITLSTCSYENNESANTLLRYVLHASIEEIT